jgi:hypothetical protein
LQKLTQVSNYDIWYLDNFYDDPDHIRDYALSLHYIRNENTPFPGTRSEELSKKMCVDGKFYSYFLEKLDQKILPFNINDCLDISTGFHKIPIIDDNLKSILNTGYIHVDLLEHRIHDKKTFAGLIYLNKVALPNSGTSFFKMKCTSDKKIKIIDSDNFKLFNSIFDGYNYDILFDEYVNLYNPFVKRKYWNWFLENKQFVDSKFEKVTEVENVYNRIVLYDSSYFHTSSHFYVNDFEDRLTQPFFIKML